MLLFGDSGLDTPPGAGQLAVMLHSFFPNPTAQDAEADLMEPKRLLFTVAAAVLGAQHVHSAFSGMEEVMQDTSDD